jgi:hypothetical protein
MIAVPRLALAGTLLLSVAVYSAGALTLCAKRSGRVVAAERCKRHDKPLTPGDLGIVSLPGQMGNTGPTGPSGQVPLRIVDGSGNDVCHVVDAGTEPACVLDRPPLPQPVLLVFQSLPVDSGTGVGTSTAYYPQPGCAGQPHIGRTRPLLPSASVIGNALYYSTALNVTLLPQSFEHVADPCPGTPTTRGSCCEPYTSMSMPSAAPAARFDLSDLGITLPLTGVTP